MSPNIRGSCMMMVLKGISEKARRTSLLVLLCLAAMGASGFFWPGSCFGKIYIDINSPNARKFKIAIPDFANDNPGEEQKELAVKLPEVISNDLDLSGYFAPMDKRAFLDPNPGLRLEEIRFKDWSVIGTELLLTGKYIVHGNRLEVEVRLFDVFYGRQLLGKRALGDVTQQRYLMHRLSDEIIRVLTGEPGIFSTKVAFVGTATGQKEIYTADYDGFNLRQITADKSIALTAEVVAGWPETDVRLLPGRGRTGALHERDGFGWSQTDFGAGGLEHRRVMGPRRKQACDHAERGWESRHLHH